MDPTAARPRHALLAGGGSGGHVFPALAVAEELAGRGWRVSWMGRAGGMEERLVAERGLEFHAVEAQAVVGRGAFGRLRALAVLAGSARRARRRIREMEADVVLGTGGYVSAPAVLGARLAGRPVLLLEPNARPGVANRWLSRWARGAAVATEGAAAGMRCETRVTGVPVRRDFAREPAPPPAPPPALLVLGGSQGALALNRAVPEALERLAAAGVALVVTHQTGAAHHEAVAADYAARGLSGIEVEVVAFLDDMATAMAAAHLVVSRAGAVTLAEICAAGRASLLVPLAIAGGHQRDNAAALERAGAAEVVADASPDAVAERLATLLADPERLGAMGRRARSLARPAAAAEIAGWMAGLSEAA